MTPPARTPNREDGWVLVSAIVLMAIMLSVGLAAFKFVDTGQTRSRESRERESSLSLAEAALYAQGFALTKNWPNPAKALTGDCSSAAALTAATLYCPDRDTLAKGSSGNGSVAQLANVDLNGNANWSTKVRDNFGDLNASYDPTKADNSLTGVIDGQTKTCPGPCRMDFNGDRQLWVSAKATVRGRPRTIVARLKLEQLRESVPQAGVVAGALDVTNNGNKLMVDGTGSSIVVRCPDLTSPSCMSYDAGKGQLTPAPASTPSQPNFMTPAQLQRFKARAKADGTYFTGCPTNAAELTGAVVWVESCTTSYANIGPYSTPCVVPTGLTANCINSTSKPGLLIWHCGTLSFTDQSTFYGIVYLVNNSDGTCTNGYVAKSGGCPTGKVYETNGGAATLGALVADGGGCVLIGSNSVNIKYDANVFNSVTSYGTVGLVQNTWRELKAGS